MTHEYDAQALFGQPQRLKVVCHACGTAFVVKSPTDHQRFRATCKRCGCTIVAHQEKASLTVLPGGAQPGGAQPEDARFEDGQLGASDQWYLARDGSADGPWSAEEVAEQVQRGELNRLSYLWRPGLAQWLHLESIAVFSELLEEYSADRGAAPRSATVPAPRSATVPAPRSATVPAPRNATVPAPRNATVPAPRNATMQWQPGLRTEQPRPAKRTKRRRAVLPRPARKQPAPSREEKTRFYARPSQPACAEAPVAAQALSRRPRASDSLSWIPSPPATVRAPVPAVQTLEPHRFWDRKRKITALVAGLSSFALGCLVALLFSFGGTASSGNEDLASDPDVASLGKKIKADQNAAAKLDSAMLSREKARPKRGTLSPAAVSTPAKRQALRPSGPVTEALDEPSAKSRAKQQRAQRKLSRRAKRQQRKSRARRSRSHRRQHLRRAASRRRVADDVLLMLSAATTKRSRSATAAEDDVDDVDDMLAAGASR